MRGVNDGSDQGPRLARRASRVRPTTTPLQTPTMPTTRPTAVVGLPRSSSFVDLGAFVGQRVTIEGVRVPGIDPLSYNVTSIQSATPDGGITAPPGGSSLPATGGTSFLLVPTIALILGVGVLGIAVLRGSR
jgi:hypothetical protein